MLDVVVAGVEDLVDHGTLEFLVCCHFDVARGKPTPALDLAHYRHAFFSGRPVLGLLLLFLGQFDLLALRPIDLIEAEDVLGPISIILIS